LLLLGAVEGALWSPVAAFSPLWHRRWKTSLDDGHGLMWCVCRSQMPRSVAGQLTLEKTPSYFVTKTAPDRVYNMSRDVRLIVVVRDPVTRAISDYVQAAAKRPEMPPFERMAFVDVANGTHNTSTSSSSSSWRVATSWGAVKIGIYARHLRRWLLRFPLGQMHFVNGERLIGDPAGEMAELQDFLGLPRFVGARHFYFNATKGFPCLRKSVTDHRGGGGGREVVRCLGESKGRSHPVVDSQVIQRLRDFFRPFNEKFYRMTGVDFEWP